MASISKKGERYYVVYRYTDSNKKERQKWELCQSEQHAKKRKAEAELNFTRLNPTLPNDCTLQKFLQEWVEVYKSNWAYQTYTGNNILIRLHILPYIGKLKIQKITQFDILKLYSLLLKKPLKENPLDVEGEDDKNKDIKQVPTLSSTTVRHVHTLLKTAFNSAVEWGLLEKTPVTCKAPKRSRSERTVWNTTEARAALMDMEKNWDNPRLHLATHLSFICSLRIGEAMGLTWDFIDFDKGLIKINKTLQRVHKDALKAIPDSGLFQIFPSAGDAKKSVLVLKEPKTPSSNRIIYLTGPLQKELLYRKQQVTKEKSFWGEKYTDYNLVFCSEKGFPVEPKLCEKWFQHWLHNTGADVPAIGFHGIRHSSTTYKLLLSGGDIKSVQGDTGHGSAGMVVDQYAHVMNPQRKRLMKQIEEEFYSGQDLSSHASLLALGDLLETAKNDPALKKKLLDSLSS